MVKLEWHSHGFAEEPDVNERRAQNDWP